MDRQGLYKRQGLTEAELTEIKQLATLCNTHDGLDLKLNMDTLHSRPADQTNDFLYYVDDQLVGYLALFSFNSQEAELSGMVHPKHRRRGIFTALFNEAIHECQHRNIPNILLIVEQASIAGQAFVKKQSVQYHHSEYKMVLQEAKLPSAFDTHLQFRAARLEDAPMMAQITAQAFGMSENEVDWYGKNVMEQSIRRYYVGVMDGNVIGKLDVVLGKIQASIYGFAVLPAYQGRGYGRQILAHTIQAIQETGQQHIALEVATENKHALSLYQSCGFKETGGYDYYLLQ